MARFVAFLLFGLAGLAGPGWLVHTNVREQIALVAAGLAVEAAAGIRAAAPTI